MIAGWLEFYTLLVILTRAFWRRRVESFNAGKAAPP
jgi:hypothetical protein